MELPALLSAWPADALEDYEERVAIMVESRVPDAPRKAEELVRRRWLSPSCPPSAPRPS